MRINHIYVLSLILAGLAGAGLSTMPVASAAIAQARESIPWPRLLRGDMEQISAIEWRLRHSAGHLCPAKSAAFGLRIDYVGAYGERDRALARQVLGLTDAPQVAVVVPGSPAELAGLVPGDELLEIGGVGTAQIAAASRNPDLLADEIEKRIASAPGGKPFDLLIRRKGKEHRFALKPVMLCAVRYVLKTEPDKTAYTDGEEIAIPVGLIRFSANDDELALIAGHELAHIVARHGKPRNLAERRRMEDEADRLGAKLTHCAGYDIGLALHFWERSDRRQAPRWLRKSTHRRAADRAARLEELRPSLTCPVKLSD